MIPLKKMFLHNAVSTIFLCTFAIGFQISHNNNSNIENDSFNQGIISNKSQNSITLLSDDLIDSFILSELSTSTEVELVAESKSMNNQFVNANLGQKSKNENFTSRDLDLKDFLAIIPVKQIKNILSTYYQQDNEILRAFVYLQSDDFEMIKLKIIRMPVVDDFLNYLKESGVDILKLICSIIELLVDPKDMKPMQDHLQSKSNEKDGFNSTTEVGLHGLIDIILETLPQDQILSIFFDKMENDENFSKLVMKIGEDDFGIILGKMENSDELKNIMYNFHNHGIYITKIVDSLKDYFFLGAF